jgi:hypothetical protein
MAHGAGVEQTTEVRQAITVTCADPSLSGASSGTSIGRASRTVRAPAPRVATGATTDAVMVVTSMAAQITRRSGNRRRSSASPTQRTAAAVSTSALRLSAVALSGSSTLENVLTFLHISTAPAVADIAQSHTSAPTLIHAGEKTTRASSWRSSRRTKKTMVR